MISILGKRDWWTHKLFPCKTIIITVDRLTEVKETLRKSRICAEAKNVQKLKCTKARNGLGDIESIFWEH